MSDNLADTIYPCPFSKAYGIPSRQAWLLLKIFLIYRFISASLFSMLFFLGYGMSLLGSHDERLYQVVSLSYLGISFCAAPVIFKRWLSYSQVAQLLILTDIICLTLMMHASGGVASGVGGLLAISIAAAGLLLGGKCALLVAALATLAVLAEELFAMYSGFFSLKTLNYSGVLGIAFFAIALISVVLAERVEQSVSLVKRHAQTITRLEELNHYIIQHLQSGIMIVDSRQLIVQCNQSLLRLLNLSKPPVRLADFSPDIQQAFLLWLENPESDFAIIDIGQSSEVHVRFSPLPLEGEGLHLLIVEDIALYNQRLQQTKLASLGRLTASIAHEIRNPLSAINHASQLLSESANLTGEDLRLTSIIRNHCRRVNKIIEDILTLSRREPSQKQRIALDQWLPAFVQEQNQLHGSDKPAFQLHRKTKGLNVFMDSGHLKQILDNLCANALKYGQPELGPIVIEADFFAQRPCIRVIDNGHGLAGEHLAHLFEPFFTTSHQGTGLGLYISKELAELNQAELIYAKQEDRTCFTLYLANADHVVIEI